MHIKNLLPVFILLFLTACGGGGSGSTPPVTPPTPDPTPSPTVLMGKFVDSAVEGLKYQTATQSGSTSKDGEFNYVANETVTFSIGDIEFPATLGAEYITPLAIYNTDSLAHKAVINMIRLLQTLDLDGMPSNGIEIPEMSHVLASGLTIDFNASNFDELVAELVVNSGGPHLALVSADAALAHFQQTLTELDITTVSGCTSTHAMVGFTGDFQTHAHNVSGHAKIVDDCTIEITNFDYDGGGPAVYFYGALNGQYSSNSAFVIGDQLNGQVYDNATITLQLPQGKTLDNLNGLSVWCADFNANFGDVTFTAP